MIEKYLFNGLDPLLLFKAKIGVTKQLNSTGLLVAPMLSAVGYGQSEGPELETSLPMKMPLSEHSTAVAIIGCGGTGSHLVPSLFQFIASKKLTFPEWNVPDLFLIDGDVVEEKNLVRQKFTRAEMGMNKAQALARRYSGVWNLPIFHSEEYITIGSLDQLLVGPLGRASRPKYRSLIIIGAVDNHTARAAIWDFYIRQQRERYANFDNIFWIDAGNESNFGQVVLGGKPGTVELSDTRETVAWPKAKMGDTISPIELPCFFDLYPEDFLGLGTKKEETLGCLALTEMDPQTIQANMMSAFCATSLCMQLFRGKITNTAMFFDTESGNTKSAFITKKTIVENNVKMVRARERILEFLSSLSMSAGWGAGWKNTALARGLSLDPILNK